MIRDEPTVTGGKSTTAGCLAIAIPFALGYPDFSEGVERAVRACNVTHTHPVAHAAVATFTVLLYYMLNGSPDAIQQGERKASVEEGVLGGRIMPRCSSGRGWTLKLRGARRRIPGGQGTSGRQQQQEHNTRSQRRFPRSLHRRDRAIGRIPRMRKGATRAR
jgi:ADP-ribosylglycohydrolase